MTANRERIVVSAGEQFRKRGFDDVTIADVMKAAGLTHGGFYGYFGSKEALEAAVCERGVADSVAAVDAVAADGAGDEGADPTPLLERFVRDYVSARHRDAPEDGCTVGALACDANRSAVEIQRIFASGITGMAESLARLRQLDSPGEGEERSSAPDFANLSTMIGALTLARAVADADPALSETILEAARAHIASSASA
ncbi:TetR/AcrR family transcriptional regulator [Streptomyces gibsoniae]|uniref:TetR/AcrR family transcriptional regulator n=1 Tax=Streptomyces gibsoniae TaxID=3075529 RepID=A0ABU2U7S5_9ACTN|nr:TetR/AcrR family transcriptional regulator [Streptomyces sp. DSM 41699]MDT0469267.1 TetR/AcrR family transcriptional regulator [Streptomyces sp. DSM 41699]